MARTIYKPFKDELSSILLVNTLSPVFEGCDPKPGFTRIWPDKDEDVPLVNTKFGLVPKGSVLSYEQAVVNKEQITHLNHTDSLSAPNFDLPILRSPVTVLSIHKSKAINRV